MYGTPNIPVAVICRSKARSGRIYSILCMNIYLVDSDFPSYVSRKLIDSILLEQISIFREHFPQKFRESSTKNILTFPLSAAIHFSELLLKRAPEKFRRWYFCTIGYVSGRNSKNSSGTPLLYSNKIL